MQVIRQEYLATAVRVVFMICIAASTVCAQPDAIQSEINRFKGHWRVIELVENGRAISEDRMRDWLPGAGVMEIIDLTILFKSPIDGTKSTKSYRLDPTTYPKQINILDRDKTTGRGIYKFDQEKLVVCVSNAAAYVPAEFSAPAGSERTLMVLSKFEPGASEIPGLNSKLPPRVPRHVAGLTDNHVALPPKVPQVQPATAPQVGEVSSVARVLTDKEVLNMAVGTWRINDTEGSIDIVFGSNGIFQTYRYYQTVSNFHVVFAPTPVSSGNWSIANGRLIATVSMSTRLDRVNQSFSPAVRSISAKDMILVDHLGRVSRAIKIR
jgi:uncharacterized protein (TIGR03067 family)